MLPHLKPTTGRARFTRLVAQRGRYRKRYKSRTSCGVRMAGKQRPEQQKGCISAAHFCCI
jgi:hypothetical protein